MLISFIKRTTALVVISSLLTAALIFYRNAAEGHYSLLHFKLKYINTQDASVLRNNIWIDTREPVEFAKGHIPQAISLNTSNWDEALFEFLSVWSPDKPVILYCGGHACGASKEAALRLLTDLPDANVHILAGGYPAWQNRVR